MVSTVRDVTKHGLFSEQKENGNKLDNKRKKTIRQIISAVGGISVVWSLIIFAGVEFPFFNHYNIFYSPYIFIFVAVILFIARTFIKDIRIIQNFLDFFNRAGLVHTSYKIDFANISPTRANYIDKEGEKKNVRHNHSFVIPNKDQWLNEYLIPDTGLAALNPDKLVQKYGARLKDETITLTEMTTAKETLKDGTVREIKVPIEGPPVKVSKSMVQQILSNLSTWIPEIQALDPMVLHDEQATEDTVDGLNQEAGYQTAEIRKGWFSGGTTTKVVAFIAVGLAIGALATLMYSIAFHLNYSNIGYIQHAIGVLK
jgi:hypothetical protein